MESLTTGDFSKVNPNEFYSLLDTLQGMDGLNQSDLEQLELSYSQFLKSRSGGLGFSESLFDSRTCAMPIPINHSPRQSQSSSITGSPLGASPLSNSPFASPNHSPAGSPVRQNALLSSGSLNCSSQLLSPHTHNRVSNNVASSPGSSLSSHSSAYTNTAPVSLENSLEQQYLQAASMAYGPRSSPLLPEDDEDEFDWSSIL